MHKATINAAGFLIEVTTEGNARRYGSVTFTHSFSDVSREYDITDSKIVSIDFDEDRLTITTENGLDYYFSFKENGDLIGDLYEATGEHIDTIANFNFETDV